MFNKSIRKIVLMVMLLLTVFLIVTLSSIYLFSYYQTKSNNQETLARYSMNYNFTEGSFGPGGIFNGDMPKDNPDEIPANPQDGEIPAAPQDGEIPEGPQAGDMPPEGFGPNDRDNQRKDNQPNDRIFTFYSVLFNDSNEVLYVDTGKMSIYTNDELTEIASNILSKNKTSGTMGSLSYLVTTRDNYKLVAFIDNSITDSNFKTILVITLIGGSIALVVGFFVSLFIAKRIMKPLEENDKRQKQFISDAGHELKTPVSIINANAEILSRDLGNNEWLNNIQYENERMQLLITELLDLSRAENSKPVMGKLSFSHLVNGEVLPFETLAFENGLEINSNIKNDISVTGNENQLKQLVSILIDNSIRHSNGGKDINISLTDNHKEAVLEVENYGNEIPKEKLEHLFERFYRIDEARNSETKHYGLGLAIAKAIVVNHNGSIKVSSSNGKVKFTVTLPISK